MKQKCKKRYLGETESGVLELKGISTDNKPLHTTLDFDESGYHNAYVVNFDEEIPAHYVKVAEFIKRLRIYDDFANSVCIIADKIAVYRAGEFDCIIQVDNLSYFS